MDSTRWQRPAAKVQRQHIRPAAKPFADIARQAGAQVTGAGADNEGIDVVRPVAGMGERAFRGLGCEQGRVPRKTRLQHIGRQFKGLAQILQRQVARGDAAAAVENLFQDRTRAGLELVKPARLQKCLPAVPLRVPLWRHRRPQSRDEHIGS
jgi:hypothetical protein